MTEPTKVATTNDAVESVESSHKEALKSSSVIGGSSIIVLLIRMIRTKVVAVVLGPAGVGLEAIYDSIVSLARTLFESGLGTSGVRQIAAAAGTGSTEAVARTAYTVRRACVIPGIVCAGVVFFASDGISRAAFGDTAHSGAVKLLSLIVLIASLATAWGALITGLRRIGDLAKMNIWGAVIGTSLSVPVVIIWGTDGIAGYMVVAAAGGLFVAWRYVRRIDLPAVSMDRRELITEATSMVRLGVAFAATAFMATGALFVVRSMVARAEGVEAVGMYQAAVALSTVYMGFVLQAMGTDYFPRLTAAADDDRRANALVNDQAEVSLLLAIPGVLGTMAFAPLLISVFYSGEFGLAADLLAWQIAGMFLRVVSWSVGFMLPAKGRGGLFVATDVVAWSTYLLLAWFALSRFGLIGVGVAFFGMYVVYSTLIHTVVRRVSGFRWSAASRRLIAVGTVTIGAALWARLALPDPWALAVGLGLAVVVGLWCLRGLLDIMGTGSVRTLLVRLRHGTGTGEAEEAAERH